ncbi:hypothetical protein BS47DRAFT_58741 [Hydnum rufescens UP504]|uniref:Uncharacterized protein n=1 Tax=Hydnum rufescens UP504 TaxID=1448309 RepID=A0A9P6ARL9_9AGAM|nr:hypothetical protein BS47DRAFT_58741 [Hydnum rufescens UP504]
MPRRTHSVHILFKACRHAFPDSAYSGVPAPQTPSERKSASQVAIIMSPKETPPSHLCHGRGGSNMQIEINATAQRNLSRLTTTESNILPHQIYGGDWKPPHFPPSSTTYTVIYENACISPEILMFRTRFSGRTRPNSKYTTDFIGVSYRCTPSLPPIIEPLVLHIRRDIPEFGMYSGIGPNHDGCRGTRLHLSMSNQPYAPFCPGRRR